IEVGGITDTVVVKAETPLVQSRSGERSFTIPTSAVENLPIANRSFTALASLAPGVTPTGDPTRIGGGGDTNIMMDGVGVMDTGSNRPLLQMNVESIAEVKVLTSVYQAEYGRSSGLQITAVTKSGTNRFRGSAYDVIRNSKFNSNSQQNILNGTVKPKLSEKDLGFSIGGPIGKPGGSNKMFFFYSQEFSPRTAGNDPARFRFPTAAERTGDFSQSLDQNGVLYNLIKDPSNPNVCTAANTSGCFQDGGVLGKIPASALYQTGLNILKMYPLPTATVPGQAFNYDVTRPAETALSTQPAGRFDYQPNSKLRVTAKYSGWQQRRDLIPGIVNGFNDTQMQRPVISNLAFSANYNLNNTTFVEGTYGRSRNEMAGCAQDTVGTNQFDTSFGFANAAIGSFSSYSQASKYIEGNFVYDNREAYIQDNWRVSNRLTLDYGMRFVHATPQYDKLDQGSNFLPDKFALSAAPQLYRPGCSVTVAAGTACPAANIQALNPVTGQLLGPNSSLAIGTIVQGSGN